MGAGGEEQRVLPGTGRALLHRVACEQAGSRAPSLVAAVVRDGAVAWFGARGWPGGAPGGPEATPDTQYRIGSITKTMVATVVMRLRDEGRLEPGDALAAHLPSAPEPLREVTLAQLLSHGSGVTAEPPGPWWERTPGKGAGDLNAALGERDPALRPGRRLHYSNVGYALLAQVIERLRAAPWIDAVRQEVLIPLGMRDTTERPRAPHASGFAVHPWADVLLPEPEHDAGAMSPAGQLWSTTADLARWAAFIGVHRAGDGAGDSAGDSAGDTGGVLAADTLAEMREPVMVEDGDAWTGGYGLGLQLARDRGRRLVGHGGSMPGFVAAVWADVQAGTAALCMANTTSGLGRGLPGDLLAILEEHEPALPAPWAADPADPELLELTGPWHWGPAPHVLRLLPGRVLSLTPLNGQGRGSRFVARQDGTWIGLEGYYAGEPLRVVRDGGTGRAVALDVNTFVFTREPYDPGAPVPGGVDPGGWRAPGS
ncbi:serine hydrolase domain-containing protein [Spongiactinospora sp. TRM90649]|uniref:serine hydrolase domain-containing protein n=1 Tax=Spongiactinospora sp. TRM90649 TaxID=3031114 RepID=UPI0023F83CAB|nr:serine hydrolase domain-containing protein [Spongiactinospora sp. TRM90649]MDF5756546.1 serine hydrolase [Spongiactinospora sp. TRM90649]